jgi:transcriptional regulator with XRE-family HTH domain
MAVYAKKLGQIREEAGLSTHDVARILGTTSRTVFRWASGRTPRGESRERLLELAAVVDLLSRVMRPESASAWLFDPNPLLDMERPVDLIGRGDYQRVCAAIAAIAEGVFV